MHHYALFEIELGIKLGVPCVLATLPSWATCLLHPLDEMFPSLHRSSVTCHAVSFSQTKSLLQDFYSSSIPFVFLFFSFCFEIGPVIDFRLVLNFFCLSFPQVFQHTAHTALLTLSTLVNSRSLVLLYLTWL